MAEGNRKIRSDTDRRDDKGRFGAGNPGRPRGSKNRTTAIAQALLADEETELVRKGIELAKAGDVQMLKFLLDRLLPKDRLIKIDIPPLDFADEAIDGMAAISSAIAEGQTAATLPGPETVGVRSSASSAPSAPVRKSDRANGFAPAGMRTVEDHADGAAGATVRRNASTMHRETYADGADAKDPARSVSQNANTSGWRARL
jgi:hypothetical protein